MHTTSNNPGKISDRTHVRYASGNLPILFRGDVIVAGGSFGGIAAALALKAAGRSVVLVEPRTYLGREMTATMRPWLWLPAAVTPAALPQPLAACFASAYQDTRHREVPAHHDTAGHTQDPPVRWVFRLDAVKKSLENLLLDAGVQLIYASQPMALDVVAGNHAVVIGNKSGRQALLAHTVIDATETALLARLVKARFEDPAEKKGAFGCTLEFTRVRDLAGRATPYAETVLDEFGLLDSQVLVHGGYRDDGHCWVECCMQHARTVETPLALTKRETDLRRVAFNVATYLIAKNLTFADADLNTIAYELSGPLCARLSAPAPAWAKPFASNHPETDIPFSAFAGPRPGLWHLNEAARLPDSAQMSDPLMAARIGAWLGAGLAHQAPLFPTSQDESHEQDAPDGALAASLTICEPDTPQRGRDYARAAVRAFAVPILQASDLLVVGGGTSGATAAITAAQQDLTTVLVDMNPGLGGTGTYGGIHAYWFGRRVGFSARVSRWVDELHDRLNHKRLGGPIPTWNIEAKIQALLNAADAAEIKMVLNTLFVGTIVEQPSAEGRNRTVVKGVVAATRLGPVALLSQVVIDASGDGDVAAFAGAAYVYGSERDHAIMYTYMAQVAKPGAPRNVKTSMVDVSNINDYTRAILEERRRGGATDHDHGIYLAPRESRHIRADVVLTLTDQLVRRCWPDVVNVAFSNNDIKGQASSDWVLIGLISPHLAIEIPYRALLPQGLDNIIIAGKAFSATHDALGAPRMQPDMENLGGVAALAAVLSLQSGNSLRAIDIRLLQKQLVDAGVLPPLVLTRSVRPLPNSGKELQATVEAISADRPLHAYSDMEINEPFLGRIPLVDALCAGPDIIPLVEQALTTSTGPLRIRLAQALAMVGSQAGVPTLIEAIEAELQGDTLPNRDSHIRHVGIPPDQGAAPDVAYLIHALGLTRDHRALPIWQQVVDRLASVTEEEVVDRLTNRYYYVTSVCFGAERLGDPQAIPLLQQLHRYAPFHLRAMAGGFEPDFLQERLAFLEIVIGRALARCGSPDGIVILITYLNDTRALLAEHAHAELKSIAGRDFGKDVTAWSQWLEEEAETLPPRPWQESTDPVKAWDEVIYIAASADQELIVGEAT